MVWGLWWWCGSCGGGVVAVVLWCGSCGSCGVVVVLGAVVVVAR